MSDFDPLDRARTPLVRRAMGDLNFDVAAVARAGLPLVLDTNAIVAALQGKLPRPVRELVALSRAFASSVVVGEITQGFYNLDAADPRTKANRAQIGLVLDELSRIETIVPTHDDWRLANAVLASLGRRRKFTKEKRRETLADALIYTSIRRAGACLVTANTRDFDLLEQALLGGRVLYFAPA
ncbi:MAG: PIN domain-containing protein [Tagaea sp.]|nr:PIN domain-containing protein [Tagaea sp.]